MSRLLSLPLVAFTLLTACTTTDDAPDVTAKEDSIELLIEPVVLAPKLDEKGNPVPGTLDFDTREGRVDITHLVSEKPREFESREAFHEWVRKALNAKLVEREDGGTGSTLAYEAGATVRLDPDTKQYVTVEDPVEMIIGGRDGYVVIDREQFCVSRTAPCAAEAGLTPQKSNERTIVPGITWATSASGAITIAASSFHTVPLAFRPFYTITGASTSQWSTSLAGVRYGFAPCTFNVFKTCLVKTGTNLLSASFFARRGGGPIAGRTGSKTVVNDLSSIVARGDWDVWPFTGTDNVCAMHVGNAGDAAVALTGAAFGIPVNDCP